jgi:hypothetical protein
MLPAYAGASADVDGGSSPIWELPSTTREPCGTWAQPDPRYRQRTHGSEACPVPNLQGRERGGPHHMTWSRGVALTPLSRGRRLLAFLFVPEEHLASGVVTGVGAFGLQLRPAWCGEDDAVQSPPDRQGPAPRAVTRANHAAVTVTVLVATTSGVIQ